MKKLFLIYFIVCACFYCTAQQWNWARKADSVTENQFARKIRAERNGNVYILGINYGKSLYGPVQLDSGSFIVKYTSVGKFVWGTNIPGEALDISTDLNDNIYVLTNRDSLSIRNTGILKFSSGGSLQWQKFFGGQSYTNGVALFVSSSGKIFVTGYYRKSTSFDSFNLTDTINSFFITGINSFGNVMSLTGAPTNGYKYGSGTLLSEDKNKTLYVIGYGATCNNYMCDGIFLNKYDMFGNFISSNFSWGARTYNEIFGFVLDDSLNIYVSGSYVNQYGGDDTLKKYDSSFRELWRYYLGGAYTGYNFEDGISIDSMRNIYISGTVGHYWNTSSDSILFDTHWVKLKGRSDIAVIKINCAGNLDWIKSAGGRKEEFSNDVCLDKSGNCYVAGVFNWHYNGVQNDTACFGSDTLINDANSNEIFIAKLSEPGSTNDINKFVPVELNIYPNPSYGKFVIRSSEALSMQIINILGEPVYYSTEKPLEEIDLSAMPKGIYFVEITSANKKIMKKVILE